MREIDISKNPVLWQPIATAPKDRRILIWCNGEMYVGIWAKNVGTGDVAYVIADLEDGNRAIVKATAWQELPAPPVSVDSQL